MNVTSNETHRFVVRDAQGKHVAAAEHIETALALLRTLPIASFVERRSDGERLAFQPMPKLKTASGAA